MRLAEVSKAILAVAICLGVLATGTWVFAQDASRPTPEVQGAPDSRIGQTQRGQAPRDLPQPKMDTAPVPAAEVQGAPGSRVGQTQRGQAPRDLPEQKMESGKVPPAEIQGAPLSRIGQTQRGQAPRDLPKD